MQTKLLFVATKLHLISWNKHILFLSSGLNLQAHFLFHVKGLWQFPTTLNKQYECEPGVCHSADWMGTCKTLHMLHFLLSQPPHTDLHLSHYGMVVIIAVFQELLVLLCVSVVYVFFLSRFPSVWLGQMQGTASESLYPTSACLWLGWSSGCCVAVWSKRGHLRTWPRTTLTSKRRNKWVYFLL